MCVCMCCAKLNLLITQANLNYFRGLLLSVCRGEGKERKGKERKGRLKNLIIHYFIL